MQTTQLYDTENDVIENFGSLVDETRAWLKQKDFKQAEILMDLMLERNQGVMRKDNITPYALHEMTQALWAINVIEDGLSIDDLEGVISVIFVHDLGENFNIRPQGLEQHLINNDRPQSPQIEQLKKDFDVISKCYGKNGEPRYQDEHHYALAVRESINASVAKLLDNLHNSTTLIGGLDDEKARDYMDRIQIQLNDHITALCPISPSQSIFYKSAQKTIGKVLQVNRYHFVGETYGKALPDNKDVQNEMPEKGFGNLPDGLHPLKIAKQRIINKHPNLAPSCTATDFEKNNSPDDKHELVQ